MDKYKQEIKEQYELAIKMLMLGGRDVVFDQLEKVKGMVEREFDRLEGKQKCRHGYDNTRSVMWNIERGNGIPSIHQLRKDD